MEWLLALICMIPAAVSDLKYRTVSLESCVAALLVGVGVFIWWALSAPPAEIITAGIMAGITVAAVWAMGKYSLVGNGDWWFFAGACAAVSTLGFAAMAVAVMAGMVVMAVLHVVMCVSRPGLPFPRRLYRHVKRQGDTFRMDPESGEEVAVGKSGMVVYPGLPMVTFLVSAAIIVGVLFSL